MKSNGQRAVDLIVNGPDQVTQPAWDRSYDKMVRFLQTTDIVPILKLLATISKSNPVSPSQMLTIALQMGYQLRILETEFEKNLKTAEEIVNETLAHLKSKSLD